MTPGSCNLCSALVDSPFSLAAVDNDGVSFMKKLEFSVPEVKWTAVVETCMTCLGILRQVYDFKINCLKNQEALLLKIISQEHDYVLKFTPGPDHETDLEDKVNDNNQQLSQLEDNNNVDGNNFNLELEPQNSLEAAIHLPELDPKCHSEYEVSVCLALTREGFMEEQDGSVNYQGGEISSESYGDGKGSMECCSTGNDQFIRSEIIRGSIQPAATSVNKSSSHFLASQAKPKEEESSDTDLVMMAAKNLVLMSRSHGPSTVQPSPLLVNNHNSQPQNNKENFCLTINGKPKVSTRHESKVQTKFSKNNSYALRVKSVEDKVRSNENDLNSSNHPNGTAKKKQIKCDHCTKSFQTKELLSRHQKMSHKSRTKPPSLPKQEQRAQKIKYTFYCNSCDKNFSFKKPLIAHARQEHDMPEDSIKPYKCLVCERRFKISSHLLKHKTCHQPLNQNRNRIGGNDNHEEANRKKSAKQKCTECTLQFKSVEQLHCHEVLHHKAVDKWRYTCEFCNNKEFASKISFNFHMRRHNGSKTYPCSICSKPFYSNSHLLKHMTTHAPKSKCYYCGKRFLSIEEYKEHLADVHNVSRVSNDNEGHESDLSRHLEKSSEETSST